MVDEYITILFYSIVYYNINIIKASIIINFYNLRHYRIIRNTLKNKIENVVPFSNGKEMNDISVLTTTPTHELCLGYKNRSPLRHPSVKLIFNIL